MSITERHARKRLDYWHNRIVASMRGADNQDPAFVYLAHRMRNMWAGRLMQIELESERQYRQEEAA